MQKVYDSCYVMDKRCYDEYALSEDILMEHASRGMAEYIKTNFPLGSTVLIVSGVGNNGADGIVLARQLHSNYQVSLYMPNLPKSDMAQIQLHRAKRVGVCIVDEVVDSDIIVDAIFGAGLNRDIDDKTKELIKTLNAQNAYKIACDVPTGILENGELCSATFKADTTITMGALKKSLYSDKAKDFVGDIICVDLGVSRDVYEIESDTYLLEWSDMKLPTRDKLSTHKGMFGHSAVFVGEKVGAGVISAMATSRFGSGLTTLITQESITPPYHLMYASELPYNTTAIAIGMGLGEFFDDRFLSKNVIDKNIPLVLDADALYKPKLLEILNQTNREIVITPHPKEFASLWEILTNKRVDVEYIQSHRFEVAQNFSKLYPHVTLLLKGANMLIAKEKQTYINPYGDARLSKGGSGDVLSGLIVALLAQGYNSLDATISASLALCKAVSLYDGASFGMLSEDIIDAIAKIEE